MKLYDILFESGLSRVHEFIMNHDCATITAFRGDPKDNSSCAVDPPEIEGLENLGTKRINLARNKMLRMLLMNAGYGVTAVEGAYIEDFKGPKKKEITENSFFVVNLDDDPSFFDKIIEFGKMFCQDSVMLIPQGGESPYLYGTNKSGYPGLDKEIRFKDIKFGEESEFMTKVRKRPFTAPSLEESRSLETFKKCSINAKRYITLCVETFNRTRKIVL